MKHRTLAGVGLTALIAALTLAPGGTSPPEAASTAPTVSFDLGAAPASAIAPAPQDAPAPIHDAVDASRSDAPYLRGQRLVRVTDPMELPELLHEFEATLLREPGRSGFALVAGNDALLNQLAADPRVDASVAHGQMHGATAEEGIEGSSYGDNRRVQDGAMESLQWYIGVVDPVIAHSLPTDIVVAVLDTGVAYESATRRGVTYAGAPSLSNNPIVAPYDFVNQDPHANDDHQHGTHIASLIASNGDVKGVAPGAALMPIKVLDEHNMGHEIALVEGLWHAIDNGAHIINMSLSFNDGYEPSLALLEALEAAHDAGIVMVAASGNTGADQVTWPAASPHVMAVGATRQGYGGYQDTSTTPYANISSGIDVLAPGGDLSVDRDGDGYPDGLIAESIAPGDPTDVGFWLMAGTSQAAALVSGLAVEIVRSGLSGDEVAAMIHSKAERADVLGGRGAGYADMDWGIPNSYRGHRTFYASVLPYLGASGSLIRPSARVALFDEDGSPAANMRVFGSIWGNADGRVSCDTNSNGVCVLRGAAVPGTDGSGNQPEMAWSIAVEAVQVLVDGAPEPGVYRPKSAMTMDQDFDALVGALQDTTATQDALLAFSWNDETTSIGRTAPSYSMINTGTGLASLPLGIVTTRPTLGGLGSFRSLQLDVGGRDVPVSVLTMDGTGLASLPLGFSLPSLRIAFLGGTGLASLPLGITTPNPGHVLRLDQRDFPGLSNSNLGTQLSNGGWRAHGYGAASLLGSSTHLGIYPALASSYEMDGSSVDFGSDTDEGIGAQQVE